MQHQVGNGRAIGVAALLAAAFAWPTLLCAITDALRSPYERALSSAWCGGAPQAAFEFLGHCPACWAGALALTLAAAFAARETQNHFALVR